MTDRYKPLFIILFLGCVLLNVLAVITWHPSLVVNDGVQYLSTARNWLYGNGFATDALIYTPHFQGVFPAPQTVWPPGYSLAVALVAATGLDMPVAALTLNLFAHATAAAVMFLIFRRAGVQRAAAFVFTFLFYIMAMPWSFVSGLITEPVFTTLLLATLLALPNVRSASVDSWLLCGALLAMCIYVRYSAVFFAASVGAGIFVYMLLYLRPALGEFFALCVKLAALTAIPVLAFSHLMYRTHLLIGTLDRYSGSKDPVTLADTLRLWVVNCAELLGFSVGDFVAVQLSIVLFAAFILLLATIAGLFLVLCARNIKNAVPARTLNYIRLLTIVMILHGLGLFLYLSASSMSDTPLEIVNRYLYQVYSGFHVLICFMIYHLWQRKESFTSNAAKLWVVAPVTALLLLYVGAQINELSTSRNHFFEESRAADRVMSLSLPDNSSLADHITGCFEGKDNGAVWSTHGQHVHFHTKVHSVTHADIYTRETFSSDTIEQIISDYDLRLFLFIENPGKAKASYTTYMSELKDWLTQRGYTPVTLQYDPLQVSRQVTVLQQPGTCSI